MSWKRALLIFGGGLAIGLLLGLQLMKPSAAERTAATSSLELARDSVISLVAENLRLTGEAQAAPGPGLVPETTTVIHYRTQIDSVDRPIKMIVIERYTDTLWREATGVVAWDFNEDNEAYTLTGTCNANLHDLGASWTDYSLDVHQGAICPPVRRFSLGGGIYAGDLIGAASVRLNRTRILPMIGVHLGGDQLVGLKFGGLVLYDL